MSTGVPYLDESWSPIHGCHPDFECWTRCWARQMAARLEAAGVRGYERGFAPTFDEVALEKPLHWRRPRRIGLCFMGDLLVHDIGCQQLGAVLAIVSLSPAHTFVALTKRAERLEDEFSVVLGHRGLCAAALRLSTGGRLDDQLTSWVWPLPNLWPGVSVSRRAELERVRHLQRTPAAHRWLSLEPLLEDLGELDLQGISWVVVGGESGRGARPLELDWVRRIRDQAAAAGVPLYFKQGAGLRPEPFPRLDGQYHRELPAGWQSARRAA